MDDRLALALAHEWIGDRAVLTPVDAMNSSTWLVESAGGRFALKIADPHQRAW